MSYTLGYTGEKVDQKLDNLYRIGDIIITSTNVNPSTDWGGTWTLVNKSLTNQYLVKTYTTTNATTVANAVVTGDTIRFRFTITPSVDITESQVEVCQLSLADFGVTSLTYGSRIIGYSDGGNAAVFFYLTADGILSTVDSIPTDVTSASEIYLNFTANIMYNEKENSFCSQFFWKKTS